jgi:hypothetical protein
MFMKRSFHGSEAEEEDGGDDLQSVRPPDL